MLLEEGFEYKLYDAYLDRTAIITSKDLLGFGYQWPDEQWSDLTDGEVFITKC